MNTGNKVTVHKLDPAGNELWQYEGVLLEVSETSVTLEAWYDRADQDFHGMPLRQGDRYVETHYSDRWYNVFELYDVVTEELKGWYCNITRPAVLRNASVSAVDLALDLLVFPDGRWLALDQEEFEAMDLSDEDRQRALDALEELKGMLRAREGPFRTIN